MTAKYSGIIFDLDGTLYNMKTIGISMALSLAFSIRYLKTSRQTLKAMSGHFYGNRESFREKYYNTMADRLKVDSDKAEEWENKFYKAFIRILNKQYQARPGIKQLVTELNVPSAVLSDYAMVDERLKALNIEPELFKCRLYSGDLGGLKPNPEVFLRTAEALGVKPDSILVVGDRIDKDGIGAERSGMDFFQVDDESWPNLKKRVLSGR